METNKLKETIEKELANLDYDNQYQLTRQYSKDKLYSLISDVAVKFAEWLNNNYRKLTDAYVRLIGNKDEIFTENQLFIHFIQNIYNQS